MRKVAFAVEHHDFTVDQRSRAEKLELGGQTRQSYGPVETAARAEPYSSLGDPG
jgi:hypothetical protein